jgi:hypothetical protein
MTRFYLGNFILIESYGYVSWLPIVGIIGIPSNFSYIVLVTFFII